MAISRLLRFSRGISRLVLIGLLLAQIMPCQTTLAADTRQAQAASIFSRLLTVFAFLGGLSYFANNIIGPLFGFKSTFTKNVATEQSRTQPTKTFAQTFFGSPPEELQKIVALLKESNFNAPPPKTILFHGPPGTGKTLSAQAIAGELKAALISVSATSFTTVIKCSSEYISPLFAQARSVVAAKRTTENPKKIHCVLFIDEIDAAAKNRTDWDHVNNPLHSLLTELNDTNNENDGILVIVATNTITSLDSAFISRFPNKIKLDSSSKENLQEIFNNIVRDRQYNVIANLVINWTELHQYKFTGRDIKHILELASRNVSFRLQKIGKPLEQIPDQDKKIQQIDINDAIKNLIQQKKADDWDDSSDEYIDSRGEPRTKPISTYTLSKPIRKMTDTIFGEQPQGLEPIICSLAHPEYFACVKAHLPRAILFYGPPGVGKTARASAIAAELGAHFIESYGSALFQIWLGSANRNIKAIFKKARELVQQERAALNNPAINKIHCVVFIDEIEAAAKDRGLDIRTHSDNPLHTLLSELGSEKNDGILVIAATNCAKSLDKAFLRRFPDQIKITRPTADALEVIFRMYAQSVQYPLTQNINIDWKSLKKAKFTGDDIKKTLKLAARNAGFRLQQTGKQLVEIAADEKCILQKDIDQALAVFMQQKKIASTPARLGMDESDSESDE